MRKTKPKKPLISSNTVWKIRRKSDGYFSNARGYHPSFSREGRYFSSERKLIQHINLVTKYLNKYRRFGGTPVSHPYLGCEIVQYKLNEEVKVDFEGYGE
jgi:hypothetical protein